MIGVCLALVMDVSASVTPASWELQRNATAAALRQPVVTRIARQGMTVTVVLFGTEARVVVPPSRPDRAAALLRAVTRWQGLGPTTNIAAGIRTGTDALLEQDCERRILDVSGDGEQNEPADLQGEIARAVENGVEINALPIVLPGNERLTNWFRANITDPAGGFLISADERGFAQAIRNKIAMEIAAITD
jgi:Ca-activated chloride channel homolog